MWGRCATGSTQTASTGAIPTHVGPPPRSPLNRTHAQVHPHTCGATPGRDTRWPQNAGSSPRMWGYRDREAEGGRERGFIPTHVGLPQVLDVLGFCPRVHPHACGATVASAAWAGGGRGSSPRMWGYPGRWQRPAQEKGFIPTHVGLPDRTHRDGERVWVHPHACGATRTATAFPPDTDGSSPRMWGYLCQSSL